jgi:hypothetical protein
VDVVHRPFTLRLPFGHARSVLRRSGAAIDTKVLLASVRQAPIVFEAMAATSTSILLIVAFAAAKAAG